MCPGIKKLTSKKKKKKKAIRITPVAGSQTSSPPLVPWGARSDDSLQGVVFNLVAVCRKPGTEEGPVTRVSGNIASLKDPLYLGAEDRLPAHPYHEYKGEGFPTSVAEGC